MKFRNKAVFELLLMMLGWSLIFLSIELIEISNYQSFNYAVIGFVGLLIIVRRIYSFFDSLIPFLDQYFKFFGLCCFFVLEAMTIMAAITAIFFGVMAGSIVMAVILAMIIGLEYWAVSTYVKI